MVSRGWSIMARILDRIFETEFGFATTEKPFRQRMDF